MTRLMILASLVVGFAPAAQAELREIDSLTCHMRPERCISKGGKFYIDWTAADDASVVRDKEQYEKSNNMWADYTANGGNPTIGNLGLWDDARNKPLPGTDALFRKYGLTGYCGGDGQELRVTDCYADRHAREIHKKFAYIKNPVERMDVGLADRFAFDMWLQTQPIYLCTARNGKCASCSVQVSGQKKPVSCEEGWPKKDEVFKLYDSYPTWKNPASGSTAAGGGAPGASASGAAAGKPAGNSKAESPKKLVPVKPIGTDSPTVIGGKWD